MELELGLKITKTRDDITSISQYQLAKDRTGPVFESRETNTMFILTAHLKGYKRNNIEIKISEDGGKISISGEKPIQEMLMMGWVMLKKHVEITKFNKAFKIPERVVLDRIKAKFDEEESVLKIVMPKSVKGVCGARIEEVKEDDEADHISNSIGETSERGFRESQVQEMEESESVLEKEEVLSEKIEYDEAMKKSDSEENVGVHIPQSMGDSSQEFPEESVAQQVKEAEISDGKVDDRDEAEKMLDKASGFSQDKHHGEWLQKEFEELESETEGIHKGSVEEVIGTERFEETKDGGDECETEKAGKEGYEDETSMEKAEGEASKKRTQTANRSVEESTLNESSEKGDDEESDNEREAKQVRVPKMKSRDQPSVKENTDKGGVHGSERQELLLEGGKSEDFKEPGAKIEQSVKKVNGEKSGKIQAEANGGFRRDLTRDSVQKEIDDPKVPTKESEQLLQELTGKGGLEASMAEEEEFPVKTLDSLANERIEDEAEVKEELVKQKSEAKVEETKDTEDGAKGEKHEKIQDETTMEGTKEPEIQTKEDDQECLLEMSKGILELSKATIEDSAEKTLDSLANKREGLKDTMPEKAKEAKAEFIKQQSGEKMEEPKDVNNKGTTIEQYAEKDITKESKIQSEEKYQQNLHDVTSEGRFGASTTAGEFPLQKNEREGPNEKEIEETMKVKEEIDKRKNKEPNVVESTEKETTQESDSERLTKTLKAVAMEKNPNEFLVGTDERELQPKISPTRDARLLSMGVKETEQGSEKKHDTQQLSQETQSKEACESRNQCVNQDILKLKKAKEAERGDQCNCNKERTEAAAAVEDQIAKPRFPATQQFEVVEGKLKEDSPNSQKEYHANDLRNSIEMKERESKHMEVLKPEVHLEELLKKSKQETMKDEFQKGEKIEEKMQEIEQSKSKVDEKDQEYVSKETVAAAIIVREMPEAKEQYASNAVSPAGRKETKKDLEATPETQKYYAQNVDDKKLGNREEIKKTVFEENDEVKYAAESRKRSQVKEHQRKSEAAEKEAEPPKLKRQIIEWKSPKKQLSYGREDTEAPKLPAYREVQQPTLQSPTLSQQSTDEENITPENAVVELPKKNTDTDYRKLVESVDPLEDQRVETFQAPRESDNQEGTKAIEEELLKKPYLSEENVHGEKGVETVAKKGEPKEDPKQLHKREKVKTIQSAIDEKPTMKDITTEFEKVYGFKQVEETMQELPTKIEMISKKGMDRPQRDETPPLTKEIQRKEPPELLWSSMGPEDSQIKEDTTDEGNEEDDIIEVEEDVSGGNNHKAKRTKKLFVPLIIAGSALLVSLVFIFVHRRRTKRR
ncbi:hypothetical protein PIB30_033117 [Stylosanthes scabra]|uniref:SHSP domain-containing protein n=1 Tax=Stylosanthes scabra TaxID=79078 RepID=A0ABU6UDP9_9FABA|nr:hypothetical protein [Stylosanthes scabra]